MYAKGYKIDGARINTIPFDKYIVWLHIVTITKFFLQLPYV